MKRTRTGSSTSKYAGARTKRTRTAYKPKLYRTPGPSTYSTGGQIGFPRQMKMSHKYGEQIAITSTNGANGYYIWVANGLYDPNYSGVGHQPYYFDQMSAIYDHYCVLSSTFTVRITPVDANQPAMIVTLSVQDDTSATSTNPNQLMEYSDCKMTVVAAGQQVPAYLKIPWNCQKYFGKSPLANTELQGTISTNPTEGSYYFVNVKSIDGISTGAIYVEVIIYFTAIWKELKDVALS